MTNQRASTGFLLICIPMVALVRAEESASTKTLRIFDAKPKAIVVNGYSTSFHWPKILQRKLDRYFEGKQLITVTSATRGGTPIAKWINAQTGEPLSPWVDRLRPALKEPSGKPVIVLAQQSLQWAFGDRRAGIRSDKDLTRIKLGAQVIERYANQMLKDGADEVFIAMHIYKKPMEPEIGNERLALAAFLKSRPEHVHSGPDVWEPTKDLWPTAFARDQVHPNAVGAEVMAQEQDALQLYTSGTTAKPRAVLLTHSAVAAGVSQLATVARLQTSDRFLLVMPLFHAAGIMTMLHAVAGGASLFIQQDFAPRTAVDALDDEGITVAMMVPTMIQRCLTEISGQGKRSFEKLRLIIYGASPIAEETLRRAMKLFGCDFAQRYGTTETLSLAWLDPADHRVALEGKPELLRSAGRPLPGIEIRVVDANDQDLPVGERGEFVVSGPQLMRGYWKSVDNSSFDECGDRWIRTGDVGYADADGYIYICDRVKDVIVSGGENIYPREN